MGSNETVVININKKKKRWGGMGRDGIVYIYL